ncbi:DUF805 domain-containing protein [Demequina sp. SYSU T00192]|uniref:DUF805 domain-containing protein n=1 Tax=Demequina litoralis TaxID=3051660 RepID=A0ABT8G7H5_9MICO|nr:DUF805 domain-containing protein [Demequina sp. SYSU T00192]MDN4475108.1 DUF805 domain-containing protein [Demequina sp. SYSU T00192]
MGFGEAVATCFRRYATFRGRAGRREFWWFQLFASLAWIATVVLASVLWLAAFEGAARPTEDPAINPDSVAWGPLTAALGVLLLYTLVITVPVLAVTSRRLHDVGMSTWWLVLTVLGLSIVLFAIALVEGQRGANRFGPDPRIVRSVPAPA